MDIIPLVSDSMSTADATVVNHNESKMQEEPISRNQDPMSLQQFVDTVMIDGKKVLEISAENMFYEETRIQRKNRWSDPVSKKRADTSDIHFTPSRALLGNQPVP